jgi:hypothetical protein
MVYIVYYNGVEVTNVIKGNFIKSMNTINSAQFTISNKLYADMATWVAYKHALDITIYEDTNLRFQGFVDSVKAEDDGITIYCKSILGKLEWDLTTEGDSSLPGSGRFIINQMKAQSSPADANLKVVSTEGADPGLTNDLYNGTYPTSEVRPLFTIISDDTFKEVTDTLLSDDALEPTFTNCAAAANAHHKTQAADGDYCTITSTDLTAGVATALFPLQFQDDTVSHDNTVTRVWIKLDGFLGAKGTDGTSGDPCNIHFTYGFSKDGSTFTKWYKEVNLRSSWIGTIGRSQEFHFNEPLPFDVTTDLFTSGDVFWEGGYILFKADQVTTADNAAIFKIDYLGLTVYSMTGTFENINRRIRDTLNDGGLTYDVLKLDNNMAQGCGLAGKAGATATGLATTTAYHFKINDVEYTIMTAADVTFTAVIALMNTATTDIATWALTGGDLVCTMDTYDRCELNVGSTPDLFTTLTDFADFTVAASTGFYDLSSSGIAEDDDVKIAVGYNEAFSHCKIHDIEYDIANPMRGVSQDYVGISYYTLFAQLCDSLVYSFFETHSLGRTVVKSLKESSIGAAAVTYSTASDPPKWFSNYTSEANEYGSVVIKYRNGLTKPLTAATPGTNPRSILIQATWINSLDEAENYGRAWAEYYKLVHPSLDLSWDSSLTNYPEPGTKYNLTLLKLNGLTTENMAFTNQICRKVSTSWGVGLNSVTTASFGGGSTPPDEAMGKWMGKVDRYRNIQNGLVGTTYNDYARTHNQLLGVTTDQHHAQSHDNTYHTATYITAAAKLNSLAAPDGDVSMNTHKITNLTNGAAASDAAAFGQIPAAVTVDDTPTDGHTTQAASSNALFDHAALTTAHGGDIAAHVLKHTYAFRATRNSSQTIGTGADTIVQYDDEVYDPSNSYNAGTYTFTAPATGVYHFDASIIFDSSAGWSAGEVCQIELYYDGATKIRGIRDTIQVNGTYYWRAAVNSDFKMVATKTMTVRIYQGTGGNVNLFSGDAAESFNYFNGHWVSDG